jgi:hypothetical protein
MPQGSVIGNHDEIELVTPDVRALHFVVVNFIYQIFTMCSSQPAC